MKKLLTVFLLLTMVGFVSAEEPVCEYPECEAPAPPPVEESLDEWFVEDLVESIISDLKETFENAELLPPNPDNPPTVGDR